MVHGMDPHLCLEDQKKPGMIALHQFVSQNFFIVFTPWYFSPSFAGNHMHWTQLSLAYVLILSIVACSGSIHSPILTYMLYPSLFCSVAMLIYFVIK